MPAQVLRLEVAVREVEASQLLLQGVERCEERVARLRVERLVERAACGQVLQHHVAAAVRACGVLVSHLLAQQPVVGEPLRAQGAQVRRDALHGADRDRSEGHGQEPALLAPYDLRLGEACRAADERAAGRIGDRAQRLERVHRVFGGEQRPQKCIDRGCHGAIPFLC